MAKIAVFDDYAVYAEMLAGPLVQRGHRLLVELSPIDFERVLSFGPDVITLGLYRNRRAFDRPIRDLETDVTGIKPLVQMEDYPAINVIPIVLIGSGLQERDVPTNLNYDLFLTFPEELTEYVTRIEELAATVKTRRKISAYVCPHCESRLVFIKQPEKDLFCPRCHATVTIVDGEGCFYTLDGELAPRACSLEQLAPQPAAGEAFSRETPIRGVGVIFPDPAATSRTGRAAT